MNSYISDWDLVNAESKVGKLLLRAWRKVGHRVPCYGEIVAIAGLIYRAQTQMPCSPILPDLKEWRKLDGFDLFTDHEVRYVNRRCRSIYYYPERNKVIHYDRNIYWYHIKQGQKVYYTDSTSHVEVTLPYIVLPKEARMIYKVPDGYDGPPQTIDGFIK